MKFKIVGMGPGHSDYVLPIAKKSLIEADVIIGGKRHISEFEDTDKILIPVEGNLMKLPSIIREYREDKRIVVAVSGDTGFYSLLPFLKKHFSEDEFDVITGIGSLQYMYAKVGLAHQKSFLGSVHGRKLDYLSLLKNYETIGLLTDAEQSPQAIANAFCNAGREKVYMYVGERLSYDDERITQGFASEIKNIEFDVLSVAILVMEKN